MEAILNFMNQVLDVRSIIEWGGLLWVFLTVLLGCFVGRLIRGIEKYLHVVIGVVILLSFLPIVFEIIQHKRAHQHQLKTNQLNPSFLKISA